MNQNLALLAQESGGSRNQIVEIETAVNKLARVQYKTSQEMQGKLARLIAATESVQQWQDAHETDRERLAILERQVAYIGESIISLFDDIDLVLNRLQGDSDTWGALLKWWSAQLTSTLAVIGIREVELLGQSFQPQWAESIGVLEGGLIR